MSGHSKWSTIKRQKGAQDAKRGQMFTKLSNAIAIAVRSGGGISDPDSNFRLRLAVDRARAYNMPKENIDRAILRAKGEGVGEVEELLYEGFVPGGIAILVQAITDNKARTVSLVKNIFEKSGGTLGGSGAASYLFERKGQIVAKKGETSFDELFEYGIEAGAQDVEEDGDSVFFYVDSASLQNARKLLAEKGVEVESAELLYAPKSYMSVDSETDAKVKDLIDKLEELDDVQEVYSNLGITT